MNESSNTPTDDRSGIGEAVSSVLREQLRSEDSTADDALEQRIEELEKRLVSKVSERERYARLFSKRLLDEGDEEALDHLLVLKNQVANLRLMLEAARAEQADSAAQRVIADTAKAYLMALRERTDEIEDDTPEAFIKRQQLVRLLVDGIALGKDEDGKTLVEEPTASGRPRRRSQRSQKTTANSNRRTIFLWVLNRTLGPERRSRSCAALCWRLLAA
jgi:hypothetical protein